MLIVNENGVVLAQSGAGALYGLLKPFNHASGVERWIVDAVNYTIEIEGYQLRLRSQVEIEADPRYQAWLKQQQLDAAQTQAVSDFSTIQQFLRTGTATQAEAWIETNVTNLATAKTALKHLARLIVLLRDYAKFSS